MSETITKPVEILYEQVNECPIQNRRFSFFQIVYILSGTGTYAVNGNTKPYGEENLFLLVPQDCHTFHVKTTTEFLLIRFNSIYLKEYKWRYIDHLKSSLENAGKPTEDILTLPSDKRLVRSITQSILYGIQQPDIYNQELTAHLINSLLIIITRNLSRLPNKKLSENSDKRSVAIINYIQKHIYEPELLSAAVISSHFNMSTSYLSRFFKKHTNYTMQNYITKYRLQLIENRLKFSDMRVNEIAEEFGFVEGSHLNKFFKNQKGMSLTKFRNATKQTF